MTIRKKIVRTGTWINPVFDEVFGKEAGVDLSVLPIDAQQTHAWRQLADAHVYHLGAAKDELPPQWHVTPDFLRHCPRLLCVSSGGAGYDTVDVAACTQAGIVVVNQAGGNAMSVAEQTLGLMIALSRRIYEQDRRLRTERGFTREDVMGHELGWRVLGLVGVGHVGTRVAALARAFGMTVLGTDPYLSKDAILERGAIPVSLEELLIRSDIVSLHCPRTNETNGLIGAAAFAKMKRGALFITTARGGIHDEQALIDALVIGQIGGAGLDVWSVEPPPLEHPLLTLDNVIATYHTAGVSHECRYRVAEMGADQICRLLNGERPPRLVNPEVWPVYKRRFQAVFEQSMIAS